MKALILLQQRINRRLMLNNALLEVLQLIQAKRFRDAGIKFEKYQTVLKPEYVEFLASTEA